MRYAPLLLILAGCSDGGSAATRASWALTLKVDGADVKVPLAMLNVYLASDASRPELFEFEGPGATLVGEFRWGLLLLDSGSTRKASSL